MKTIEVPLAGKTYMLEYDFNAIVQVQTATNVNVLNPGSSTTLDPIEFRANVWALLLKHHPEMTVEQAGSLITLKTLPILAEALQKAWQDTDEEVDG